MDRLKILEALERYETNKRFPLTPNVNLEYEANVVAAPSYSVGRKYIWRVQIGIEQIAQDGVSAALVYNQMYAYIADAIYGEVANHVEQALIKLYLNDPLRQHEEAMNMLSVAIDRMRGR